MLASFRLNPKWVTFLIEEWSRPSAGHIPPLLKHKEIFFNDLAGKTKIITWLLSLSFWNLQTETVYFCPWRSFTAEIVHKIPLTWLLKPSCDLFSASTAACEVQDRMECCWNSFYYKTKSNLYKAAREKLNHHTILLTLLGSIQKRKHFWAPALGTFTAHLF